MRAFRVRCAKSSNGLLLGIIPARGGSKGIPGKNRILLSGRPLIAYTIKAAQNAESLSDFLVSTEDKGIAAVSKRLGAPVPFLRPKSLAGDGVPMWPVVRHAVKAWEEKCQKRLSAVVLLQPTSPLRSSADIDLCVGTFHRSRADACVSVANSHANPYLNMVRRFGDSVFVQPFIPMKKQCAQRQEAPPAYVINGAVYVIKRDALDTLKSLFDIQRLASYEMPFDRSVDIDTPDDLSLARYLMKRSRGVV